VLGAVDVLDADQTDEVRVRFVVVERQLAQLPDRLGRVEVLDVQLALQGTDSGVRPLQDRDVELFLAAEVVVDHPLGGTGLRGDLVHPGAGVPLVGELVGGHGENLGAGSIGVPHRRPRHGSLGRLCGHGTPLPSRNHCNEFRSLPS
jgi:hypothetical protein